jgi:hypothetical protein
MLELRFICPCAPLGFSLGFNGCAARFACADVVLSMVVARSPMWQSRRPANERGRVGMFKMRVIFGEQQRRSAYANAKYSGCSWQLTAVERYR